MRKKRPPKTFAERMAALSKAGLKYSDSMRPAPGPSKELESMERAARLRNLIELLEKTKEMKPGNILAFIMYDVENNRIRRYIAKYLEKQGYVRVQKSVFFGHVSRAHHKKVCQILKEVNSQYENGDSLLFLPVSIDMFHNLQVVGKNLDYELTVSEKSTLFF